MPTDYGKFIEEEQDKRRSSEEDAEAKRLAAKKEKDDAAAALAKPLDDALEPALEDARRQLSPHGITIKKEDRLNHHERGDFEVYRFFRLEKQNSDRGRSTTSLYGFRVYLKGNIEAVMFDKNATQSGPPQRISLTSPGDFNAETVETVIKQAVAELVRTTR